MARYDENYKVALLCPVYNEEETVATFVKVVEEKLNSELDHLEIVFVDDGSKDHTVALINELMQHNDRISLIQLSRNFGKEAAMTAAVDLIDADAIIPIDVDLQDPPELILEFIKIWRTEDVDTVYGMRTDRSQDTETKRLTSGGFYYVFNKLSNKVKIPENVGDFRLIDRKVILTVRSLHENNRFMKGLYAWPGFTAKGVPYSRPERSAGTSKWNYWKLWNFALDGIVSFSSLPLRIWSYLGAFIGGLGLIYMLYIIIRTLITGVDVPGYASLICVILFLGSIQLISIGVIGEYIGRMSEEVKKRPVYVVAKVKGALSERLPQGYQEASSGIFFNDAPVLKPGASNLVAPGSAAATSTTNAATSTTSAAATSATNAATSTTSAATSTTSVATSTTGAAGTAAPAAPSAADATSSTSVATAATSTSSNDAK